MYLLDAVEVLVRRWYVVAAGVLLMALGVGTAVIWAPSAYQATGQVLLLLPPQASGEGTPTNPYLNLPGEMTTTASLVAGVLMTPETQRSVAKSGFHSEYSVALQPEAGPLLVITAADTDPRAALATRDELVRRIGKELKHMQRNRAIPERLLIRPSPTAMTNTAENQRGSKIRALAAILGVGVVLTLVATFAVDRIRWRRRDGEDRSPENGMGDAHSKLQPEWEESATGGVNDRARR